MNRNLVGSIYGRFCIKFPQSRMKGERQRLSPLSLQFDKFMVVLNFIRIKMTYYNIQFCTYLISIYHQLVWNVVFFYKTKVFMFDIFYSKFLNEFLIHFFLLLQITLKSPKKLFLLFRFLQNYPHENRLTKKIMIIITYTVLFINMLS